MILMQIAGAAETEEPGRDISAALAKKARAALETHAPQNFSYF